MEIERKEDGSFVLVEIEDSLGELLLSIPEALISEDSEVVHRRLYPDPIAKGDPDGVNEEWREYVKPDLAEFFETTCKIVETDLEQLEEGPTLRIAPDRVDAWLNTLNQARIALAARFDVSESDMEQPISTFLEGEREIALFQIHFYGFLQECLIRGIESLDF